MSSSSERSAGRKPLKIAVDARVRINRERLDLETQRALREMFTHPNPKHANATRMGFYADAIPKFITSFGFEDPFLSFPRGALSRILEFLEGRGYAIEAIIDRSLKLERIELKLAHQLYPYQQEAVDAIVRSGNCVVRGPCGSGKSATLLGAIAALKQPTLVVVHTEALRKQWSGVVSDWLGFVPGRIGGGKEVIRPVTIGMQQSIWRRAKENPEWTKQFGCIIGDEVHKWGASSFQITATMFPAAYRVGASADEKRKDGLEFLIYDTFGPCVYEIKREHLVMIDRLLPVEMLLVKTGYENDAYVRNRFEGFNPNWNALLNDLTQDEDRNALILNVVLRILQDPKSRVLILSERVQACVDWKKVFDSHGYPCGLMIGGAQNKDDVSSAIAWLKTGRIRVAAGTKIADEGLDIPQLTHVVVTCPLHTHPQRLEQMTGRCARVSEGKTRATAVYFWDERMFPNPATEDDDPFKRRGRARAFFRGLKRACSTLSLWDPASGRITDAE